MAIESIDLEKCIGCGICMKSCSVDVIRLDKSLKVAVIQYPDECMVCLMCQEYCQTDAISISSKNSKTPVLSWG